MMAGNKVMIPFKELFQIYGHIGAFARANLLFIWISMALLVWILNPIQALPYPSEVWKAAKTLYDNPTSSGLVYNIYVTLKLNVFGLGLAAIVSLILSYISVIPFFHPLNKIIQTLRYIPVIGFNLVFLTVFTIGWSMKLAMLVTGMTFFLTTGMTGVVLSVPRLKYELAQVLGYNDWQVFYSVVVRPTLPQILDVIAQNAAIGWLTIVAIETYNRTEGGMGSQIEIYCATNQLPEVYVYLIAIGVIAVVEDWCFIAAKRLFFPYSIIIEKA
jgi:ABC-type nitrate/sulfonate/bicarbonate transport system permease component